MQNKKLSMQTILITDKNSQISYADRGLNYGDGFFTTAKIGAGQVEHWPLHKARLIESAARLGFPEINFQALEQQVSEAVALQQLGVLKVLVTRGAGGRGYALPSECHLTILLTVSDYPTHYAQFANDGVRVNISPIKLAAQPLLAGLKTLNRLEQVLIKNSMQGQDCDDVLVLDYNNHVIEASAANVFVISQGRIFSPLLTQCGIKGVYLQSLCDKLAVEFKHLSVDDLLQADAVFICNSLMGAVPVSRIAEHTFNVVDSQLILKELLAKEAKC